MRNFASLALLFLAACSSGPPPATFPAVQSMLDQVTGQHSDLVRLTVHAVPTGGDRARVIASTSAAKLGQWSDPEDVKALDTGETITMDEGPDLDYTMPVMSGGKAIAAVGVTVKGASKESMLASAKGIAQQVADSLLGMPALPW
jgi:hypothetical protein